MTEPIFSLAKFGIIGFGEHAKNILGSFSRTASARLSHLGTLHPEKTEFVRRKHPQVIVADRYDAVLESAEVEAVLITLPNHLHAEWIERTLAAKKHVLCEKPLCLDSTTAQRLVAKAEQNGLLLAEAFYYREHPQHKTVKNILFEGDFGEIQRIEVRYHYLLEEKSNFRLKAGHGSGVLLDAGCYGIDCARYFFAAEPESVKGRLSLDAEGVDRRAEFELSFPKGGVASVYCSMDSERESSVKIFGSAGMISIPNAFHVQAAQKVSIAIHRAGEPASILPQQPSDQYAQFIDRFAEAIVAKTKLPCPLESGEMNMRVLEQVRRESAHVSIR